MKPTTTSVEASAGEPLQTWFSPALTGHGGQVGDVGSQVHGSSRGSLVDELVAGSQRSRIGGALQFGTAVRQITQVDREGQHAQQRGHQHACQNGDRPATTVV